MGRKDAPECQRHLQVPFENGVFVGDSPQTCMSEYAEKQLANLQKRIWLIEFLYLGLIIVYQGGIAPTRKLKTAYQSVFLFGFQYFRRVRNLTFLKRSFLYHFRTICGIVNAKG